MKFYKDGAKQVSYAATLTMGSKTVSDFVDAIFLAAKHDGILIGTKQFAGTIISKDAMAIPSTLSDQEVNDLFNTYKEERDGYPESVANPVYNNLTANAAVTSDSKNASTVAFTNKISQGEKIVFEGTHTSNTIFAWDSVQVNLFAGMSGYLKVRADRWVETDTDVYNNEVNPPQLTNDGVDVENDQGGTFKAYYWQYTKSNDTFNAWDTDFRTVKNNGYVVITLDWKDRSKLAVTISLSASAQTKNTNAIAFTYTFTAEQGYTLEESYNFAIIANYCAIDLKATEVPTRG